MNLKKLYKKKLKFCIKNLKKFNKNNDIQMQNYYKEKINLYNNILLFLKKRKKDKEDA